MTAATNGHGAAASTVGRLEATGDGAAGLKMTRPALDQLDQLDQGGAPVELAASTRARARASTIRPDIHCQHCGRRMSPGRHGRRRYCSNGCRQGAYKRRRRSAAGVTNGQ